MLIMINKHVDPTRLVLHLIELLREVEVLRDTAVREVLATGAAAAAATTARARATIIKHP